MQTSQHFIANYRFQFLLISPFDFTYLCVCARACVLLSSIIDCLLFVTRGAVTGVLAMDNEHAKASNWVGFRL